MKKRGEKTKRVDELKILVGEIGFAP